MGIPRKTEIAGYPSEKTQEYLRYVDYQIGMRIRFLRLRRRMTQRDLAVRMGVNTNTVARWESAQNTVSVLWLAILADVLDCQIAYFFDGLDIRRLGKNDLIIPNTQWVGELMDLWSRLREDQRSTVRLLMLSMARDNAPTKATPQRKKPKL